MVHALLSLSFIFFYTFPNMLGEWKFKDGAADVLSCRAYFLLQMYISYFNFPLLLLAVTFMPGRWAVPTLLRSFSWQHFFVDCLVRRAERLGLLPSRKTLNYLVSTLLPKMIASFDSRFNNGTTIIVEQWLEHTTTTESPGAVCRT